MRKLDGLKPAEIKEAAAALAPEHGHFEAYQAQTYVADRLESSTSDRDAFTSSGYGIIREQERYFGRVKRALDALAVEGTLIRVGANQVLPSGLNSYNTVQYFTPEAFAVAKERGDQERAQREAEDLRWTLAANRLDALGIKLPGSNRLALEDLEKLLTLAEAGL